MKTFVKFAGLASIAALISMNGAYAAQDRMEIVKECFAKATKDVPDATGARSAAVQEARANVYSSCMKDKGEKP